MIRRILAAGLYVKIIGDNKGDYPYRVGLNTLEHNGETFDAEPVCGPGGLYYCDIENATEWLNYGNQLCIVEPVGRVVAVDNKFKTDKLNIVAKMDLSKVWTWEFLLKHGADIDDALEWAAKNGHLDIVKFLVKRGVDIHAHRDRAFHYAAQNGHLNIVKFLFARSADGSSVDIDYMLRWSAEEGRIEVVKFLINRGAKCSLMWAAENGNLEIVNILLAAGADTHETINGALLPAVKGDNLGIVKALLLAGADVRANNAIALQIAIITDRIDIANALAEKYIEKSRIKDAWRRATEERYRDIVNQLHRRSP